MQCSERLLKICNDLDTVDLPDWHLIVALAVAWLIIYLCLCRKARTISKVRLWANKRHGLERLQVAYFTATFPYILLLIFFICGSSREGHGNGVAFYTTGIDKSLKNYYDELHKRENELITGGIDQENSTYFNRLEEKIKDVENCFNTSALDNLGKERFAQ